METEVLRQRQRDRHKTIAFNEKNKGPARAFFKNIGTFLRRTGPNNNMK